MKARPILFRIAMVVLIMDVGITAGADTMVFQIGGLVNSYQSYNPSTSFIGTGFVSTRFYQVIDSAPGNNFASPDQYSTSYYYTPYFIAEEYAYVSTYISNASGSGYRYTTWDFWETQIQVDVSALAGLDVSSASLSFNTDIQYDYSGTDINLQFTSFDSNGNLGWYNSLDTVGTAPGGSLGSVGLSFPETQTGVHSIDVTGLLQDRIDGGENYFAMLMETTSQSYMEYAYQSSWNASHVFLTVNYDPITVTPEPAPVPVPAAAGLGLLGMGLVSALRRKKKATQV